MFNAKDDGENKTPLLFSQHDKENLKVQIVKFTVTSQSNFSGRKKLFWAIFVFAENLWPTKKVNTKKFFRRQVYYKYVKNYSIKNMHFEKVIEPSVSRCFYYFSEMHIFYRIVFDIFTQVF